MVSNPKALHPKVEAKQICLAEPTTKGIGTIARRFQFLSPMESGYPENDNVTGELWFRRGYDKKQSAVIMVHGAFAASFAAEVLLSKRLIQRGAHVYAISAPFHMNRAPEGSAYSGQYLMTGDILRLIDGLLQAVADVRTLILSLRELGYPSVSLLGTSLGGNIASLAVSLSRVEGAYLLIPAVDMYRVIQSAPIAKGMLRAAKAGGFVGSAVGEAMRCVTTRWLAPPATSPSKVAIHYGRWDAQVSSDTVAQLSKVWPGAILVEYPRGHRTIGLHILRLRRQLGGLTS